MQQALLSWIVYSSLPSNLYLISPKKTDWFSVDISAYSFFFNQSGGLFYTISLFINLIFLTLSGESSAIIGQ